MTEHKGLMGVLWGLVLGVIALWIYDRWGRRALNAIVPGAPRGGVKIAIGSPGDGTGDFPPGFASGVDCGGCGRC